MRLMGMDPVDDLAEKLMDAYVASLGDGVRNDVGDARIIRAIRAASKPQPRVDRVNTSTRRPGETTHCQHECENEKAQVDQGK